MFAKVILSAQLGIFVEPAFGEGNTVLTTSVLCMCVCVVHMSIRICPGHKLYIYAWISK